MTKRFIVEGTTDPEDFELTNVSGDDLDVELEIFKRTGPGPSDLAEVDEDDRPDVEWLDEEARTVRVTGLENLALGSYQVRFKVLQGADFGFVPDGEHADLWIVVPVGNR